MKQLIFLSVISFLLIISSCSKEESSSVIFVISNNNSTQIKNVQIKTSDNLSKTKEITIEEGKTMAVRLYLDRTTGDGYYMLQYRKDSTSDIFVKRMIGHYSKGNPLDYEINISLNPDTLLIRSVKD